jgi:hypothetical protein
MPSRARSQDRVTAFNQAAIQDPQVYYLPRNRGAFLYLDRWDHGRVGHVCRLTYTGEPDRWEFAIYR